MRCNALLGDALRAAFVACSLLSFAIADRVRADEPPPKPVTFSTNDDHQQMLRQLGIRSLRPGPSGNEKAPNHANYDESQANPFPKLPPLLIANDGTPITTAEAWTKVRRAEIVEQFEREVVGRVPATTPAIDWHVRSQTEVVHGDVTYEELQLEGVVDSSQCPEIEVKISAKLGLPKNRERAVPVLIMFSGFGFGGPGGVRPSRAPTAPGAPPKTAPSTPPTPPPSFGRSGPTREQTLAAAGWGYVLLNPTSVQADKGDGLTRGIIGLVNRGQPRKPDDWGALRAWAWGASRTLDYLEKTPGVDAKRIAIEGVSRYGKAALVTMAFDERFAAALVASSGEGGAKLHRRNFGEAVENLTGSGEYHWMAGNFLKYGAAEAQFGSKNAGDIPVDAHQLIALCAPRLTFISYGIPEKGDAKWLDQRGSYMAAVAAQPAFRLLGVPTLGVSDDFLQEPLPAVNQGLLDGHLAWRQHDGGHTSGPNLPVFLEWANKKFAATAVSGP